jgi:hypothetical protein
VKNFVRLTECGGDAVWLAIERIAVVKTPDDDEWPNAGAAVCVAHPGVCWWHVTETPEQVFDAIKRAESGDCHS